VETVAAAAARAARVFLLRLPSGLPRLRGTDGQRRRRQALVLVAAPQRAAALAASRPAGPTSSGQPPAPAAPVEDMAEAGAGA
jgi:hypothetical protein